MADIFVIMHVGKENSPERVRADEVSDYVLRPVLKKLNLSMIRADQDPTPGSISPKMIDDLLSARVVIADLTGPSPNVYYELGIAHSFNRPVISLGQPSGLPFDVQDERVIPLPPLGEKLGVADAEKAQHRLHKSLNIVLDPNYIPKSPLTNIAAMKSLDQLAPSDPVAAELSAIREQLETVHTTVYNIAGSLQRQIPIRDHDTLNLVYSETALENVWASIVRAIDREIDEERLLPEFGIALQNARLQSISGNRAYVSMSMRLGTPRDVRQFADVLEEAFHLVLAQKVGVVILPYEDSPMEDEIHAPLIFPARSATENIE